MPTAISTIIAPKPIPTISPARVPGGSPRDEGGGTKPSVVDPFVVADAGEGGRAVELVTGGVKAVEFVSGSGGEEAVVLVSEGGGGKVGVSSGAGDDIAGEEFRRQKNGSALAKKEKIRTRLHFCISTWADWS
ncbi:conserved hypothetical protein [Ricinus communis]|uniref:Uncharacterized protein n=1 Tax=Ricinus communis TaxID=3988 RepID=B9RQM5_RICCO|nr:conserved hypothetical protein [Ricinus communis]